METSVERSIGTKIRELRKALRLTQPKLAKEMQVIRSAVAKWEAGNHLPRPKNIKKLEELAVIGTRAAQQQKDNERNLRLLQLAKFFEKLQKVQPKQQQEPGSEQIVIIGRLLEVLRSARGGSADAKEILYLSTRPFDEVESRRSSELNAARKREDQRDVEDKFYRVYLVKKGRAYLAARYVAAGRRELGRFGAKPPELAYVERMINARVKRDS